MTPEKIEKIYKNFRVTIALTLYIFFIFFSLSNVVAETFTGIDTSSSGYFTTVSGGANKDITGNINGNIGASGTGGITTHVGELGTSYFKYTSPAGTTSASDIDGLEKVGSLSQTGTVEVIDPKTTSGIVIPVYKDVDIIAAYRDFTDPKNLTVFTETDSDELDKLIYKGAGIGEVDSTGGILNVDIGDSSKNVMDADNNVTMMAKDTVLFKADGTTANQSSIVWKSDNSFDFEVAPYVPSSGIVKNSAQIYKFQDVSGVATYEYYTDGNGNTTIMEGQPSDFTIGSTDDLVTYSNFLQGQFEFWVASTADGGLGLTQNQVTAKYNGLMSGAMNTAASETVKWEWQVWDGGNVPASSTKFNDATGDLNVVYVKGENADMTMEAGSNIAAAGTANGVIRAEDEAVVEINGNLHHWRESSYSHISVGVNADSSNILNNGVINSGFVVDKDGVRGTENNYGSVGIIGKGSSIITNNGIINQSIATNDWSSTSSIEDGLDSALEGSSTTVISRGMELHDDSQGVNSATGIINIVAGNNGFTEGKAYAVSVEDDTSFDNQGIIYIGREEQMSSSDASADISMTGGSSLTAAIYASTGGEVTNNGIITIGGDVSNAAGMLIISNTGDVKNSGTINVLGVGDGRTNYGMTVRDSGTSANSVINEGVINVSGKNNYGIHLIASTAESYVKTTSSGEINVSDGSKSNRNYAVVVEGGSTSAEQATVDVESRVNLNGAGNIGIYVQNHSTVNVSSNAGPFIGNEDQIAFLLSGIGSVANIAELNSSDNGNKNAVLFQVMDGASFDGSTIANADDMTLTVSGVGSKAIVASGVGSKVETGGATINVAGAGSIGVCVEGGATADIAIDTVINLTGAGATAIVVDGQKHTLSGTNSGSPVITRITSENDVASTSNDVIAYSVLNKGELILGTDSTIELAGTNNIGVIIGANGKLTNNSNAAMHIAHGVGIEVSGANSLLAKLGNIKVDDGVAGVLLKSGASVISSVAGTIDVGGSASGILLKSGAVGVGADDLTINAVGNSKGIENIAETSNIKLSGAEINIADGAGIRTSVSLDYSGALTNIINVLGSGVGFKFAKSDDTTTTNNVEIGSNYTINIGDGSNSATGNGVVFNTAGTAENKGTIKVIDNTGGSAVMVNSSSSFKNTGEITSLSQNGLAVVDASSNSNKIIINENILHAVDEYSKVIQTGSGSDTVTINNTTASTQGNINLGTVGVGLSDYFEWTAGSFSGSVDFEDGAGRSVAKLDGVDISNLQHVKTGSTSIASSAGIWGNTLELSNITGTSANIGSFIADDISKGVNIGSSWNSIVVNNASDVKIIDDLIMEKSGSLLAIVDNSKVSFDIVGDKKIDYNVVIGNVIGGTDELYVAGAGNQLITGAISGTGSFTREDGISIIASSGNSYAGDTTIANGAKIIADTASALSTNSAHIIDSTSYLDTRGFSQQTKDMINDGTVNISTNQQGNVGGILMVNGDYTGNGGKLILGFNGKAQSADMLNVNGAVAGTTTVTALSLGLGAQTDGDGIEIIRSNTSTGSEFTLEGGSVFAGAYEYKMYYGGVIGGLLNSWFLRSTFRAGIPLFSSITSSLTGTARDSIGTLHTRMGDIAKDEDGFFLQYAEEKRVWSRIIAKSGSVEQSGRAPIKNISNSYGLQVGIDFYADENWHSGGYFTFLETNNKIYNNSNLGYEKSGKTKLYSYYLGGYATYMPNYENHYYVDTVLQVGYHDIKATAEDTTVSSGNTDSTSYAASIETGYPVYFGDRKRFSIEPQAQLIYSYIDVNDASMDDESIKIDSVNSFSGRVGLRMFDTYEVGSKGLLSPYIRGNIWYTFADDDEVEVVSTGNSYNLKSGGTSYELGLGLTYKIEDSLNVYGEYTREFQGSSGKTKINHINNYNLGIKYKF